MRGEEVQYPVVLLRGAEGPPMAFDGPGALFVCGRFEPEKGPLPVQTMLVDAAGRNWRLDAIRSVNRRGPWWRRFVLWFQRRRLVEYEATENSVLSLHQIKAILMENVGLHEDAIQSSLDIDALHRRLFLSGWAAARREIADAPTFEALCKSIGFKLLVQEHWFSAEGRSERLEFFTIMVPVAAWILALVGWQLAVGYRPVALWEAFVGIVALMLPSAVAFFAALRRMHDLGYGGYLLAISLVGGLVADRLTVWLTRSDALAQWAFFAGLISVVLAIGALPGSPNENHYGQSPSRA